LSWVFVGSNLSFWIHFFTLYIRLTSLDIAIIRNKFLGEDQPIVFMKTTGLNRSIGSFLINSLVFGNCFQFYPRFLVVEESKK